MMNFSICTVKNHAGYIPAAPAAGIFRLGHEVLFGSGVIIFIGSGECGSIFGLDICSKQHGIEVSNYAKSPKYRGVWLLCLGTLYEGIAMPVPEGGCAVLVTVWHVKWINFLHSGQNLGLVPISRTTLEPCYFHLKCRRHAFLPS